LAQNADEISFPFAKDDVFAFEIGIVSEDVLNRAAGADLSNNNSDLQRTEVNSSVHDRTTTCGPLRCSNLRSSAKYSWTNKIVAIAVGERRGESVVYEVTG
jgi:hypothetical protein